MNQSAMTLDVREDIRNGCEPFARIAAAVAGLMPDQDLLLIAPFEPVPLFRVLARQGFRHSSRQNAIGDWEVLFTRTTEVVEPGAIKARVCECNRGNSDTVIQLDARGLEPPQPLVAILEALASLPEHAELRAQTDRRPLHLYAQLEERGFIGQTEETEHGSYITLIRHH